MSGSFLPDDTIEFDPDPPADRPIALMIGIGVLTLLVLAGLGYVIFGNLGANDPDPGLLGPGAPSTIGSPSPDPSPTPAPSTGAGSPVPISATSAASTPPVTPTTSHPVTATPSTSSPATVTIGLTGAHMQPKSYTGAACPGTAQALATVAASGPVTITYHWAYTIDGKPGTTPAGTYRFNGATGHQFAYQFADLTMVSGKVDASFVLTAPVNRRALMEYTQTCGADATPIVMKDKNPKCGSSVTLESTLRAGVGPMTVTYKWRAAGVIISPLVSRWDVPVGGGQHPANPERVPITNGLVVTLLVQTPVPFQTQITLNCTR